MAEEKKSIELTLREQEEVAKLFEEFASREWETASEPVQEEQPDITPDDTEPAAPAKKKLSRKALLAICAACLAGILLISLCVIFLLPSPKPPMPYTTLSAGSNLVAAVTNDGKVLTPSAVSSLGVYPITRQDVDVLEWTEIVSISVGALHTLGLKSDGTVVCTGFYESDNIVTTSPKDANSFDQGQTNVSDWSGIIAVAAGYQHSVGLREDGTVVAVGDNSYGQCDVKEWTDIIQISAGFNHTVGLKSDGTVVSTQIPSSQPDDGQCNVGTWTDIVYISAGGYTTIGVRADGTVVAAGANALGQCNVATWTDIVSVAAGIYYTVGLKKDGTVVSTKILRDLYSSYYIPDYGQSNLSNWKNIVAIAVTEYQAFGLKDDGTVVYAGLNTSGMDEVKNWANIRIP